MHCRKQVVRRLEKNLAFDLGPRERETVRIRLNILVNRDPLKFALAFQILLVLIILCLFSEELVIGERNC